MNSQVLFVEGRVQNVQFGPNLCYSFPFVFQLVSVIKVNSKCQFHHFACYCLKNVCLSLPFFVNQYPSPVTTLDFNLECCAFQFVEFGLGMSIWCHWFSHLSSSIPFMRSYLYMLNNFRNCFLCYKHM